MDFFPDFDEFSVWGYLAPGFLALLVFLAIWRWFKFNPSSSSASRFLKSIFVSVVAISGIAAILILLLMIVFGISNPSIL